MFADPEEHRTGSKWTVPATMLLNWPLLAGGLAIVLLYLRVSPQGVAIGALAWPRLRPRPRKSTA